MGLAYTARPHPAPGKGAESGRGAEGDASPAGLCYTTPDARLLVTLHALLMAVCRGSSSSVASGVCFQRHHGQREAECRPVPAAPVQNIP